MEDTMAGSGEIIELGPGNTATYRKRISAPGGGRKRTRVVEEQTVDAHELLDGYIVPTVLPQGCRAVAERDGVTVYAIECSPCVRTIRWHVTFNYSWRTKTPEEPGHFLSFEATLARLRARNAHRTHKAWFDDLEDRLERHRGGPHTFSLAMPYVVLLFRHSKGRIECGLCYYRRAPVRGLGDELLVANLPNVHRNAFTCFDQSGHYTPSVPRDCTTAVEQVQYAESLFWGNGATVMWTQYGSQDVARTFPAVATPWEWEFSTLEDPTFPLRTAWLPMGYTLGEAMEYLLRSGDRQVQTSLYDAASIKEYGYPRGDPRPAVSPFEHFRRRVRDAPPHADSQHAKANGAR